MSQTIRQVLVSPARSASGAQASVPVADGAARPGNALVLSGGGARGAYHAGVLSAIAERIPDASFSILTGISAGAINAAYFASQECPLPETVERMREEWLGVTPDQVFRTRPTSWWFRAAARWSWRAAMALPARRTRMSSLLNLDPLRVFINRWFDAQAIDRNIAAGRLHALAVSATSYASGRSVTFVHGASDATLWRGAHGAAMRTRLAADHLLASAAIPVVFQPIRVGAEFYGDGGVRHTSPLAPALRLGARSVLAIGTGGRAAPRGSTPRSSDAPTVAEGIGVLLDSIFLDALEADAEQVSRLNRLLKRLPPGVPRPPGLRPVNLVMLRPSRDLAELAVGHGAELPRRLRTIVRVLGGEDEAAAGLLSYLLFERPFTSQLMELGYDDTVARWPVIDRFFGRVEAER
jgi:NTE family protein